MTRQPDAADEPGDDLQPRDRRADARRAHRDSNAPGDHPDRARRFELDGAVVRYDARPDRCTIYPRDANGVERMATWLTADASAFVLLEEAR